MERPWTEVVAAVIYRTDGSYLLAQRPPGKAYAGYWEFPGGKVEPGESLDAAIKREIREELDIEISVACPWLTRTHVYQHASVRLHFFRVREWQGVPHGLEGQRFAFQMPGNETVAPMLPANGPILQAVGLPQTYGVTGASAQGVEKFIPALETALTKGLRLVQVREKGMAAEPLRSFAQAVVKRCHAHGARCLINGDAVLAQTVGADGVHLNAQQLMQTQARPGLALVAASVHTRAELEHAAHIGCDFAVLGAVLPTASHPGATGIGWDGFAGIAASSAIPVYAIGGMDESQLYPAAWRAGAHGVAMLRAAWR